MSPTSSRARSRRTIARHGALRSPSRWGQIVRFLAVAVAVVLVSGVGIVGYQTVNAFTQFADNGTALEGQSSVPPDIGEIEGGVNLFIAGTDACEAAYADLFGGRCSGPDAGDNLNDVNMLLHISDNPRRVTVISFPRDLMMPIPACTDPETGRTTSAMSKAQLNSTYSLGGLSCTVKTISTLTGLDIPFAATMTWGGVIEVTNAIGGVTVCVAEGTAIKDPYTGLDMGAGDHTVSGYDALQFLRTRHGVGDGGDLGRISNQQQYMSKLARKLVSEQVISNPATLYNLALTALKNVSVSDSLKNPMTMVQIALAVKDVPFDQIVFVQYPTSADPADANRVVPDRASAKRLFDALAANQIIDLSGTASGGDGVVVETPAPTESPAPTASATPTESATPSPGATADTTVTLPSNVHGSNAAQTTCSNGNVKVRG